MTGRQKIIVAAERFGWDVRPRETWMGKPVGQDIVLSKGRNEFRVECKANGSVIAVWGHRNYVGRGKADQLVEFLSK